MEAVFCSIEGVGTKNQEFFWFVLVNLGIACPEMVSTCKVLCKAGIRESRNK